MAVALAACAAPIAHSPASPSTPTVPAPVLPSPYPTTPIGLGHVTLGDGLVALNSYKATFVLTATGSIRETTNEFKALMTMSDERTRPGDAQQVIYTYSDTVRLDNYRHTEQVRVGTSSFLVIGLPDGASSCIAQPIRETSRWELVPFAYSDLGDLSDARYVGDETFTFDSQTVRARHYVIERSVLGAFPNGHADLWIAIEGGYIIRLQATASGNGPFRAYTTFDGQLTATYAINHLNRPISIKPPVACTGDLPLMPDAAAITIAANMIAYETPAPIPTVIEFYRREMQARGWSITSEPTTNEGVTLCTFQRGAANASLMLAASTQSRMTQVVIVTTPSH